MPTFGNVQVNQLDDETTAWFADLLTVIETLDAHAYVQLMTDDVVLRLADGTTLSGRDQVEQALAAAWESLAALTHHERTIYGTATGFAHEAEVEIRTRDGATTGTLTTAWIDRAGNGLVRSIRLFG